MFSYLHLFIRITLDQHTVIFHPDDGNSLWSVTFYPAIFYTPHIAPRINFFIQMLISKHHSPLKTARLQHENKTNLEHLCQKLKKYSKTDGNMLQGQMNQLERAPLAKYGRVRVSKCIIS